MFGRKYKRIFQNLKEFQSSSDAKTTLSDENITQLIDTSNHFYESKRKNRIELKANDTPPEAKQSSLSIETLNSIFFENSNSGSSYTTQIHYSLRKINNTIRRKQSIEKTLEALMPINIPEKVVISLLKIQTIEGFTISSYIIDNDIDNPEAQKHKGCFYIKQYISTITSKPHESKLALYLSPMKLITKYNDNQIAIASNTNSVSYLPIDNIQLIQLNKSIENLEGILKEKEKLINDTNVKYNEIINQKDKYKAMLSLNEYLRKKAQEYIHSIKGNLRVYCRVRPASIKTDTFISYPELDLGIDKISTLEIRNKKTNDTQLFNFDRIFIESNHQETVFEEIKQFVQSGLDGENICIFAYGATGSGKTFTMQGDFDSLDGAITKDSGILPRCATFIFEEKNRMMVHNESFEIHFAAIEIYNENIYDLLSQQPNKVPITIYCANNTINIPGLKWEKIALKTDIIKYTNKASESRRSDSTSFNSTSSRSHAIFQIKIIRNNGKKNSMINIIDLAGSERSQMTSFANMKKEQIDIAKKIQNEANFINKSLSALGRIINMIGDQKNAKVVIPYRESKLTIALQNYLKPNSKTVMIVNVSSEVKNYAFTKESLMFAANAMINC